VFAEAVPWAGLKAVEIQQEVLELGNELDLSSPRVALDPFNTVLHYGLSRDADDRRLSLEQIRDLLSEHLLFVSSILYHLHSHAQSSPFSSVLNAVFQQGPTVSGVTRGKDEGTDCPGGTC